MQSNCATFSLTPLFFVPRKKKKKEKKPVWTAQHNYTAERFRVYKFFATISQGASSRITIALRIWEIRGRRSWLKKMERAVNDCTCLARLGLQTEAIKSACSLHGDAAASAAPLPFHSPSGAGARDEEKSVGFVLLSLTLFLF